MTPIERSKGRPRILFCMKKGLAWWTSEALYLPPNLTADVFAERPEGLQKRLYLLSPAGELPASCLLPAWLRTLNSDLPEIRVGFRKQRTWANFPGPWLFLCTTGINTCGMGTDKKTLIVYRAHRVPYTWWVLPFDHKSSMRSDSQLYSTEEENDFCHFTEVTQPESESQLQSQADGSHGPHFHPLHHRCQQDPHCPPPRLLRVSHCLLLNPAQGWSLTGAPKMHPKLVLPTGLGGQGPDPWVCLSLVLSTEPADAR